MGFYRLFKVLEYETANPGQDFNEKENKKAAAHVDEENPSHLDGQELGTHEEDMHNVEMEDLHDDAAVLRQRNNPYAYAGDGAYGGGEASSTRTSVTLKPALQQVSDILAIMQDELQQQIGALAKAGYETHAM